MMSRDVATAWMVMSSTEMGNRRGYRVRGEDTVVIRKSVSRMLSWRYLWDNPSKGGGSLEVFVYLVLKFLRDTGAGARNQGVINKWVVIYTL